MREDQKRHCYGLELAALSGVQPLGRYTPVPGGPPELRGVVNYRGQICSILDLARMLGLPAENREGMASYVLFLRCPGRTTPPGLAVGPIEGLLRVELDRELLPSLAPPAGPYLEALGPNQLQLLSPQALLAHPLLRWEAQAE